MRANKDANLALPGGRAKIFAAPYVASLACAFALLAPSVVDSVEAQDLGEGAGEVGTVDSAWQRSAEQEQRGDFMGAARTLRPWAERYEQDYALQLQVAWMYFQGGAYAEALPFYERADGLAAELGLARLGTAWTLLKLGEHERAAPLFEEVLAHHEDASARQGLTLAHAAGRGEPSAGVQHQVVWATGSPIVQSFTEHPEKISGAGVRVGAGLSGTEGLQLSGLIAYTLYQGYDVDNTMGMGPGSDTGQARGRGGVGGDFSSSELYLHAGWSQERWALHAHLGGTQLGAGTSVVDYGGAAGATLRLSWLSHLYLGASKLRVSKVDSTQANAAWAFALGDWGQVVPSGKVMWVPGRDTLAMGGVLVAVTSGKISLWGSARFGRGYHMVDFALPLLWNQEDDVLGGAAAGIDYVLNSRWQLSGSAAAENYERDAMESSGVFVTVGLQYKMGLVK